MFSSPTYSRDFTQMNNYCPTCGLQYEIEPGFFWGAMYISYGLTIGISIILGICTYLLTQSSNIWVYVSIISVVLILGSPYNFRLSRALMIHVFSPVNYEPGILKKKPSELGN